jgi:FlaG/FlaF family flagellin (archaellin)
MKYGFNKSIIYDDKAVTIIIGTILMVAIVVSISAAGYLYLNGIGYEDSVRPKIHMMIDENNDRLYVAKTDMNIEWGKLSIKSSEPVTFLINGEVVAETQNDLEPNQLININNSDMIFEGEPADYLSAGVIIDLEGTDGIYLEDVTIWLVHKATNSLINTYHFSDVMGQDLS